jgi:predicted alpha/beta-hydrolase family hydrolase
MGIEATGVVLEVETVIPEKASGVVLFAHADRGSRRNPRNRLAAEQLHHAGLGTVLLDLLTAAEGHADQRTARVRMDVGLLAGRLVGVIDHFYAKDALPVGLFGLETGAAALAAAARRRKAVRAVVCRGGRPDRASAALPEVLAPTLFIVGANDEQGSEYARIAADNLSAPGEIRRVPAATRDFVEPGAAEQVAKWAADWFHSHLARVDDT